MRTRRPSRTASIAFAALALVPIAGAQDPPIPHGQDRPPNPALSPAEAIAAMTVPEGFAVELVVSEPDLVNPVAMTFDEKGRIWVTESLEYPRREPGPGRDRVKIFEDTDGDGTADSSRIFAEGLNIPSGIAVGHGGVWVANSPDILFYPDADRDGVADGPPQVVVTGFGRDDTHELPNSLTWGPDGWLYGWNGVFNRSKVEQDGKTFEFTCAVFRIHPLTREFELFCEGTSNPWGIAFDPEGSLFASACVIDHLWHLVETGYYHRQGGPYPPFTWKIESIVDHRHYKAAYCGIHYFDSPAYPEQYRGKLYMGNIHGNSINADSITRDGSTYRGHTEEDFLRANDAWFMPVVQKTGPDGSLYVLDWYDRYHCYQDANRDPEGIDRLKGRLYRVRYGDTPRRANFDLGSESDEALIQLLDSPNVYDRDIAHRLLIERLWRGSPVHRVPLHDMLRSAVFSGDLGRDGRLNALWVLVGWLSHGFDSLDQVPDVSRSVAWSSDLIRDLIAHDDPTFRAWGVRYAGNLGRVEPDVLELLSGLAADPSRDVQLQAAIASTKIEAIDAMPVLIEAAANCEDDELIPRVAWRNLLPLIQDDPARFADLLAEGFQPMPPGLVAILPRAIEVVSRADEPDTDALTSLLYRALDSGDHDAARNSLRTLFEPIRDGNLEGDALDSLRETLVGLAPDDPDASPVSAELDLLLALCGEPSKADAPADLLLGRDDRSAPEDVRMLALDTMLASSSNVQVREAIAALLAGARDDQSEFIGRVLSGLGRADDPELADVLLGHYDTLSAEIRPRLVELLTQRPGWSRALIEAIGEEAVPADALNVNQIRSLLSRSDPELADLVRARWGTVREGRDPAREQVLRRMESHLDEAEGDPLAGRVVFERVCAQCHTIYGKGENVGPDLTGVGRGSYEQLLSNVFDPSLVIGASYQATIVATDDGRILTGLLEEDSESRVVLKLQGGRREVIPRDEVDELAVADVSLMPENLEEQISPRELADLFAFLCLDRSPDDPDSRPIEGTPRGLIGPRPAASSREGSKE